MDWTLDSGGLDPGLWTLVAIAAILSIFVLFGEIQIKYILGVVFFQEKAIW